MHLLVQVSRLYIPAASRAQFLSPKNNPVINVTNKRKLGEEKGNSPNRIRNSPREKINRRRQKEEKDILACNFFLFSDVYPGFNKKYVKHFFGVETQ